MEQWNQEDIGSEESISSFLSSARSDIMATLASEGLPTSRFKQGDFEALLAPSIELCEITADEASPRAIYEQMKAIYISILREDA